MRLRNIFKFTKHDENGKEPPEGKISRQELYVFGACILVIAGLLIFTFGNTDKPDANTADISSISSSSESEFSSELRISSSVNVVASNSPVLSSADYSSTVSKVDSYEIKYDYEIMLDDLNWVKGEEPDYVDYMLIDKDGAQKSIVAFEQDPKDSTKYIRTKIEDYKADFYGMFYKEINGKKVYTETICFERYYKNSKYYYESYNRNGFLGILSATTDGNVIALSANLYNRLFLYDAKQDTLKMIGDDNSRTSDNVTFSEGEKYIAYSSDDIQNPLPSPSVYIRNIDKDRSHLLYACKEETYVYDLIFYKDTMYVITSDSVIAIDTNTNKVIKNISIKTEQSVPYRCGNNIVNLDFILDMSTGKVKECKCDFVRSLKESNQYDYCMDKTVLSSDMKYVVTPLVLYKKTGGRNFSLFIVTNFKTGKYYTYNFPELIEIMKVLKFEGKTLTTSFESSQYSLNLPSLP